MFFRQLRSASVLSPARWPLPAVAALLILLLAAALLWAAAGPAGAQDGYQPDQQVVVDVWSYARETDNGFTHVLRWMQVLHTFGALEAMSAAEARDNAGQFWAARWDPVADELAALEAQDDYVPDSQVVDDVWSYARETDNGFTHVLRWMRVLHTLGAIEAMTSAEAQGYANQYLAARWDPVADELAALEAAAAEPAPTATPEPTPEPTPVSEPTPDPATEPEPAPEPTPEPEDSARLQVSVAASPANPRVNTAVKLSAVIANAPEGETPAYDWEAGGEGEWQSYSSRATLNYLADQPESWTFRVTVSYGGGESATSDPITVTWTDGPPNQAPVVNTQSKYYASFLSRDNAPRGVLVWKRFQGIFSDPDGDELTYSVAVTQGRTELVQDLDVRPAVMLSNGEKADMLFLIADADGWKSLTSSLANPQVVTVTLTATDPGGLSASVSGDFSIEWGLYPEVVSARAEGAAIVLTFDWAVEANPAPNPWQFTVNVVNEDGSTGTVEVNSVSVDGKVVTLDLASALDGSQTVTLDYNGYNYLTGTPLQRAGGGDNAPSFTGQAVDIPRPPEEPQNLALSATPGSLDIPATWDALDGADTYKLRWRLAGGEFEAANAATVTDTSAAITVPDYGEWEVRLQGCNDAGCGPEATGTVTLVQIPGEPENLELNTEAGSLDVLATWDEVDGATSYKLRWRQAGGEFEADNAATVADAMQFITVSDYGQWEVHAQGCNDAGCGPEASRTVDVVKVLRSSLAAQDAGGDDRPRTITANWDPVPDAASYTLRWQRIGVNPPEQEQAQRNSALRQAQSASGGIAQRANAQPENRITVPAGQTSAEFNLPDGSAYEVELQAHAAGNALIARSRHHVNQAPGQPDTTPPRLVWGEMDGDRMFLYFSEPLNENIVGGCFFTLVQFDNCCTSGGWGVVPRVAIEVSGNKVFVDFKGKIRAVEGLRTSVSYWVKPGDTSFRDLAGNKVWTPIAEHGGARSTGNISLRNITGRPFVTGVAVTSDAGDDRSYKVGDSIRVKMTFSEAVNVTGTPRVKIDLDPAAGGEKWANYSGGTSTRKLEFTYTVAEGDSSPDGIAVLRNTLELNGGAIRSASAITVEDTRLAHAGLSHDSTHKVVTPATAAPLLLGASVTGTTLTLTFNESLSAAASLANSAFAVKKTPQGASEQTVSLSGSPAIDGATVTLTLASPVLDSDTGLKVSYAKPASGSNNKLVDAAGS